MGLTITILDYGEWEVQKTQCIWLLQIFHTLKDLILTLLIPLNYFAPIVALGIVDALIGNVNQEQIIPSILQSRQGSLVRMWWKSFVLLLKTEITPSRKL